MKTIIPTLITLALFVGPTFVAGGTVTRPESGGKGHISVKERRQLQASDAEIPVSAFNGPLSSLGGAAASLGSTAAGAMPVPAPAAPAAPAAAARRALQDRN